MRVAHVTLPVALTSAIVAGLRPATGQVSPGLANPDKAAVHLLAVGRDLEADSVLLASLGLPFRPSVAVVADSAICASGIQAYNNLFPPGDTTRFILRGYVLGVGQTVLALVPETMPDAHIYIDRNQYTW